MWVIVWVSPQEHRSVSVRKAVSSVSHLCFELKLSYVFITNFHLTTQHFHLVLEIQTTLFTLVRRAFHRRPSSNMRDALQATLRHLILNMKRLVNMAGIKILLRLLLILNTTTTTVITNFRFCLTSVVFWSYARLGQVLCVI